MTLPRISLIDATDAVRGGRLQLVALGLAGMLAMSAQPVFAQSGPKMPRKPEEEKFTKLGTAEQQFPFGATWILSEIGGKPTSGDAPSFALDDKLRAVGFGGCNTFSMALYPIKEQKLAAGSIAMTRKTCGKDLDTTEKTMLVTLHSLPKWHLEANGELTVVGPNNTVMKFKRGL